MKKYYLPYEQIDKNYQEFTRKNFMDKNDSYLPTVWQTLNGQWLYAYHSSIQKALSKEDAIKHLDERLIKDGHELLTEERAKKLKVLL